MSAAPHSPYPDIVERLRLRADGKDTFSQHHGHGFQSLCKDAAAEIEHLAADIAVKARLLTAQTKEIERLTAPAQYSQEPVDLAEIMSDLTNLILNERVASYNEGFDAGRVYSVSSTQSASNPYPDCPCKPGKCIYPGCTCAFASSERGSGK